MSFLNLIQYNPAFIYMKYLLNSIHNIWELVFVQMKPTKYSHEMEHKLQLPDINWKDHYTVANEFAESLRTNLGRNSIETDSFVRILDNNAKGKNIKKITKLRCKDIEVLICLACKPLGIIEPVVQGTPVNDSSLDVYHIL